MERNARLWWEEVALRLIRIGPGGRVVVVAKVVWLRVGAVVDPKRLAGWLACCVTTPRGVQLVKAATLLERRGYRPGSKIK